jgi:hypothetical protein
MKVKVAPPKWDVDALHRHSDHVQVKREAEMPAVESVKQSNPSDLKKSISDESTTETLTSGLEAGDFLDEDFDGM